MSPHTHTHTHTRTRTLATLSQVFRAKTTGSIHAANATALCSSPICTLMRLAGHSGSNRSVCFLLHGLMGVCADLRHVLVKLVAYVNTNICHLLGVFSLMYHCHDLPSFVIQASGQDKFLDGWDMKAVASHLLALHFCASTVPSLSCTQHCKT